MELIGITALINTFGDGDKTWKDRIKAGMPVKVRAQKRGASHVFDSQDVTKWLLNRNGDEDINPSVEKALLDRARRRLVDLEYESKNALLIPASTVETTWSNMTSAARARLLALPYRIAMSAMEADGNFVMVEHAANELIYEALNELHSYDLRDYGPWK